jgi:hypothetical protein
MRKYPVVWFYFSWCAEYSWRIYRWGVPDRICTNKLRGGDYLNSSVWKSKSLSSRTRKGWGWIAIQR